MSISVYSILMAVFWSSGLVFIIYRVRKRNLSNRRFGITSMVVLYLFFPDQRLDWQLSGHHTVMSGIYLVNWGNKWVGASDIDPGMIYNKSYCNTKTRRWKSLSLLFMMRPKARRMENYDKNYDDAFPAT